MDKNTTSPLHPDVLDAIQKRFPATIDPDLSQISDDVDALANHLARANDLTVTETREQIALLTMAMPNQQGTATLRAA